MLEIKIYQIVNQENNKAYIGQTRTSLRRRFYEHCWAAAHGGTQTLHKAIRKYGKESFKVFHQATVPFWLGGITEAATIRRFNTVAEGYNSSTGGDASASGMKHTDEWKRNHSAMMSGSKHPLFGKQHSAETKALLSAMRVNKLVRKDVPTAALLFMYQYHSTRQLSNLFGMDRKSVTKRLHKARQKTNNVIDYLQSNPEIASKLEADIRSKL